MCNNNNKKGKISYYIVLFKIDLIWHLSYACRVMFRIALHSIAITNRQPKGVL